MEGQAPPSTPKETNAIMSVQQRRFAAASRTAAPSSGSRSRIKLTLTWLVVVTALSLFTFSVVGTAATAKPDVAGAAKQLPSSTPKIVIKLSKHDVVCTVNATQLPVLQSRFQTGWMTVTINDKQVDLLTVTGASQHDVRTVIGKSECVIVQMQHVFYLPFDAQLS
jgi:hypothetical protein